MRLFLAPLADFTDAPFRRMCAEGGADLAYTEMTSAAALFHGHAGTRLLMETMPGEGPVACQFFGADERELAFAAKLAEEAKERFVEVNLNAGCPMPKIMETGSGATLAGDPAKVFRLLKAMKENTSLPITLKTRLGLHRASPTIFELLDAAESAGAAGIIVHARSAGQKHGGAVNLELLAETVARAKIPVCGNGSVVSRETLDAMAATGVSAIMIGRAALANPQIFAELKGEAAPEERPSGREFAERHLDYILQFRALLAEGRPEMPQPSLDAIASIKMHLHLFRYFAGLPGAAKMRRSLDRVRTLAQVREILSSADRSFET